MKIILASTVESISTRQDGTIKIVLGTQEIDSTQAASVFALRGKFCKVLLTDSNIQPLEESLIEETKIQDGKKIKTQSKRLRDVLFLLWKNRGNVGEFDHFYRSETERIIEHYKNKLD